MSQLQATLYHARKRRITARSLQRFGSLIASPHDLGASAVTLPAAGVIGVSSDSLVDEGDLTVTTASGREIYTTDLPIGSIHKLGYFEKGNTLEITFRAGDVTLHVFNDWGVPFIFATGTFV